MKTFLTIGVHVYHPLLRNMVPIASMDINSEETTASISLFFKLLNSALRDATGDSSRMDRFCV